MVEESAGLIKILISSRNDRTITCHLEAFTNITINANDNHTDIARFVEHEVDTRIKSKKLLWGKVSTELRETIKETLCEQADGMLVTSSFKPTETFLTPCTSFVVRMEKQLKLFFHLGTNLHSLDNTNVTLNVSMGQPIPSKFP